MASGRADVGSTPPSTDSCPSHQRGFSYEQSSRSTPSRLHIQPHRVTHSAPVVLSQLHFASTPKHRPNRGVDAVNAKQRDRVPRKLARPAPPPPRTPEKTPKAAVTGDAHAEELLRQHAREQRSRHRELQRRNLQQPWQPTYNVVNDVWPVEHTPAISESAPGRSLPPSNAAELSPHSLPSWRSAGPAPTTPLPAVPSIQSSGGAHSSQLRSETNPSDRKAHKLESTHRSAHPQSAFVIEPDSMVAAMTTIPMHPRAGPARTEHARFQTPERDSPVSRALANMGVLGMVLAAYDETEVPDHVASRPPSSAKKRTQLSATSRQLPDQAPRVSGQRAAVLVQAPYDPSKSEFAKLSSFKPPPPSRLDGVKLADIEATPTAHSGAVV